MASRLSVSTGSQSSRYSDRTGHTPLPYTNMHNNDLAITVKKTMVDLGLDKRGAKKTLAAEMGISQSSLSMALSGYRQGPGATRILKDLQNLLYERQHH